MAHSGGQGSHRAAVVVIGAGQAGLSAGYHLEHRGFVNALEHPDAARSFIMVDANPAAGGAWQHRWTSLRMETVNGIFDLPNYPKPPIDPAEPSRTAVPAYFAGFEQQMRLPILRPVSVSAVTRADDSPTGDLMVESSDGQWRARAVINATGTWNNPLRPHYPGYEKFRGHHVHTRDYVSAEEFSGQRVAVVGGGISAIQLLDEISQVARTAWYTRREPVFHEGGFRPEVEGRETIAHVTADAEAGRAPRSVVSYTGLGWTPYAMDAYARGALNRRQMFTAIEPSGVREADGTLTTVDVILWATGFRPDLSHLDPLRLRNSEGGIAVTGTSVTAEPRVHLIGYGPSQSTVGANRAGRDAARDLSERFSEVPSAR